MVIRKSLGFFVVTILSILSSFIVLSMPPAFADAGNDDRHLISDSKNDSRNTYFVVSVDGHGEKIGAPLIGGMSGGVLSRAPAVTCSGSYDYPHASTSSNRTKVNAHISVKCVGALASATKIRVQSQMLDGKGRRGSISARLASGSSGVKVGGDLSCTADKRMYQAIGTAYIYYPPGMQRSVDVWQIVSKAVYFKKVNGKCV